MPRKKKNLYLETSIVKAKHCAGKATAAEVRAVAKEYVVEAVASGRKTKAQAEAIINKVTQRACAIGSVGAKRKPRRKTTRRKTTTKK